MLAHLKQLIKSQSLVIMIDELAVIFVMTPRISRLRQTQPLIFQSAAYRFVQFIVEIMTRALAHTLASPTVVKFHAASLGWISRDVGETCWCSRWSKNTWNRSSFVAHESSVKKKEAKVGSEIKLDRQFMGCRFHAILIARRMISRAISPSSSWSGQTVSSQPSKIFLPTWFRCLCSSGDTNSTWWIYEISLRFSVIKKNYFPHLFRK